MKSQNLPSQSWQRRTGRVPCGLLLRCSITFVGCATWYCTVVATIDSHWLCLQAHHGWKSGVNTLTGLPNGLKLTLGGLPVNETHGPVGLHTSKIDVVLPA